MSNEHLILPQSERNVPFRKPSRRWAYWSPWSVSLFFLFLSFCAFGQSRYKIGEVLLRGNTTFSKGDLQELAFIQTPNWIEENILSSEPSFYTDAMKDQVSAQLKNFYQKEGFLSVRIEPPVVTIDEEKQTVSLEIEIEENAPVIVESVSVVFGTIPAASVLNFDSLLAASNISWNLQKGKRFRDELAAKDQAELGMMMERNGFPFNKIQPAFHLLHGDTVVEVQWNIDPGRVARFGEVVFEGNDRTPEGVIRKRLDFEPGDIYDISKLKRSQRDIFNLSVFHGVNCKAQLDAVSEGILPVKIRVQEAPTVTTKFGVGYGKEDKFRAFVNLQLLRFLGGARTLDLFFKHSALTPYHASITFVQPDLPVRLAKLLLNPYAVREVEPAYTADRLGANVSVKRTYFENLELSGTFAYERVDQRSSSTDSVNESYAKSTLALRFLNDASRPLFDPLDGWYAAGGLAYNRLVQFDSRFYETDADVRSYIEPVDGIVLAGKVKTAVNIPLGENKTIPVEERLYAGGATSIRGFPRSSLGPVDESGTPIGGNTLLETSVESRFVVAGSFGVALFCDAGNVWAGSAEYHLNDLRYSFGVGVRFKTPVGPLRFDLAHPIFEGNGEYEYYFTLGHAF